MHYHPLTGDDRREMLEAIGVNSFDDLLTGIPEKLRVKDLSISEATSELELRRELEKIGSANQSTSSTLSFLGGGSYEHFIPAALPQLMGRNEFYTAYTPYQPEASQGTLQVIFEYQSLIAELTGMDVSNASHYDGGTSLAEAGLLALRHTGRRKILVARSVHLHYRQVLQTYLEAADFTLEEFGFEEDGRFHRKEFENLIDEEIGGVIFQTPNFFGVVEDLTHVADLLHSKGALFIVSSNPLSLGVLRSPGEWGADLSVGEGQVLGLPLGFGGPYLGYFAATKELLRKIPGRLAGMTMDREGKRAFVLTLQAREQHIRRERASSNICTNQGLCALGACIYLTLLGKAGVREVGELNVDRANYLREQIAKIPGFRVNQTATIFNEFLVYSGKPFSKISEKLLGQRILPGINVSSFYPELKNAFLVCATETKTQEDLDRFVKELSQC